MASDEEDFEDLEALRQAALASLAAKSRPKNEEIFPSTRRGDDDEDLTALREAALRSSKVHSAPSTRDRTAVEQNSRPFPQHHRRRHPKQHPRQRHPYESSRRNGNWMKFHYSRGRSNNRFSVPLAQQGRNIKNNTEILLQESLEPINNTKPTENKNLLLPQDKWAGVQPSASENSSSTAERNPKRRKDNKFSRYDDSESDEDSGSDSDLSMSSESQNKDMSSDSEQSVSNSNQPDTDTRIVTHDETKDIVIQKAVSDNIEMEATGDSLEIQDKLSTDGLLEDFDEPLLDIVENGVIDDTLNSTLNTSDIKPEIEENLSVDLVPSESLDLEEEPVTTEVFEARKKKFETTEEIKGPHLKKTISLKGIVPKSRKRHRRDRHHQETKSLHSSHEEELPSQDLNERDGDEVEDLRLKTSRGEDLCLKTSRGEDLCLKTPRGEDLRLKTSRGEDLRLKTSRGEDLRLKTSRGEDLRLKTSRGEDLRLKTSRGEDLRLKTSRGKDYQRHLNKYSSASSKSSDDGCYGGSFSDGAGQPIRLKGSDISGQPIRLKGSDISGQPIRLKGSDISGQPIRLKGTDISTSSHFGQPPPRENNRRVVTERSPLRTSSRDARFSVFDESDSSEDNENSVIKKRSLSSVVRTSPKPKRHKSRKVFDSDQDSNLKKRGYSSDSKTKQSSQPRGWAALIESRSQTRLRKEEPDFHRNNSDNELEEQIQKSPPINVTFENDETYPTKIMDDKLSVHQRLGLTSKSKLVEISEKSTEKPKEKRTEEKQKTSSGPSKETELDRKILRIQEMNAAILKRQAEVKKDKERYG